MYGIVYLFNFGGIADNQCGPPLGPLNLPFFVILFIFCLKLGVFGDNGKQGSDNQSLGEFTYSDC
jgi:hypothetical protein